MNLNPEDGYPEKICDSCLEELVHFCRFKGRCFETKAKLKEMVDVKNNFSGTFKKERIDDDLFEAAENEIPAVPVMCELNVDFGAKNNLPEVSLTNDAVNETNRRVKRKRGSREHLDEYETRREVGSAMTVPFQPILDTGTVEEETPQRPEVKGMLTVKKSGLIYAEPFVPNVGVDDSINVNPEMCSSSESPKKSKCDSASNLENPIDPHSVVAVKQEEISDDETCVEQGGYLPAR